MKYIGLVLKSARRSKRRTLLTIMSVAIAVFLFASLRAVLDGFNAAAEASSSTRIVTQRATSLFFSMPSSHGETIKSTPGVEALTWANWFGGVYKDPQNFFAQFAVDPESYLRLYPEVELTPEERTAFLQDRTGCIVGDGLAKRFGFKVGDKITLQVGIPVYGTRDFDFNVRGIYRSGGAAADHQPTLFVAGNTMAMSVRERTTEIAVMRTLGFPSGTIFLLIAGEGLMMAVAGGLVGAVLARVVVNPDLLQMGAFIPAFGVNNANLAMGLALSAVIGALAGIIPAT